VTVVSLLCHFQPVTVVSLLCDCRVTVV